MYVHNATVSSLLKFLDQEIPYIWVLNHLPNERVEWWHATVPLSSEVSFDGLVRSITYDLQMKTEEFIKKSKAFDESGIDIIQSKEVMPDTLHIRNIDEKNVSNVLVSNGATLKIHLPHSNETAQVISYVPGYLESKIS